jgi:hypothetical protein
MLLELSDLVRSASVAAATAMLNRASRLPGTEPASNCLPARQEFGWRAERQQQV